MENICAVCNEYLQMKDAQVIRLRDSDKKYLDIIAHIKCSEELWKKFKSIKDFEKKSIKKVLDELKLKII